MNATAQSDQLPDSPYPGIDPFDYARRKVFFVRDKEARTLMQLISMYRGVLLYSDSGTGKSSLVNAGLIPLAVERGFQPERIRVQPRRGEEIIIERLSERVDNKRPFLPSVFASDEQLERVVVSVEEFEKTLRQPELAVRPLLIFDQFEEWITLFEEGSRGEAAKDSRIAQKSIREVIVFLINDRELRVKVLIVLREDYLAKLDPLFGQCPSLPDRHLRLTALGGDQIYRAIRGPFKKHPGRYQVEISPTLAEKIREQFEKRSEGADIHLSEVQIVCRSLFEAGRRGQKIDQHFTDEGGVQGILERHLELALESLNIDQQEPAVALLTRMLTSAGTRNVISEDDLLNRVENEDRIPRELLVKTLQSLEQGTKLVLRERRREVYYYEIASEFLVGWIRRKALERQRLMERRKLEEARRAEEQRREMEAERARADEAQRRADEQARIARRFRRLTAALVAMVVTAIVAAVYAYHQVGVAQAAQRVAEQKRQELQKAVETAGRFGKELTEAKGKLPVKTNSINMKLVYIPAGSFMMGSSHPLVRLAKEYDIDVRNFVDEFPQHEILISKDFWMGQTEVTQGQYKSVMNAEPWSGKKHVQEDANNPAVYVSWDDAVEFCRKLSQQEGKTYRLPTEAEWEYACRAGTTTRFSFGDSGSSLGDYAWFYGNTQKLGQEYAQSVKQRKPNPWGLYDMHGNVWEWCSDWYIKDYYSNSPSVDPKGPAAGLGRSLRGGSWLDVEVSLRCTARDRYVPDYRDSYIGFRVVLSQP